MIEPITAEEMQATFRSLSPAETVVLDAVFAPFTTKQIVRVASQRAGRLLPYSTVATSLSNLRRFGYLTSQRRPKHDGKASVMIWRRAT